MGSRDCYTTRAVCLNIVYLESIADCQIRLNNDIVLRRSEKATAFDTKCLQKSLVSNFNSINEQDRII